MEEKYNLLIRDDLGESEKNWEDVIGKIREIAGSIGWDKTIEIIGIISYSVKPDGAKQFTAEEIIKVLNKELGKTSREKEQKKSQSYYGKYSFSGEPDL